MLTGIKTRIQTDRFDETLRFYTELLGLIIIREWNDEADTGAILGLPDADAKAYLEIASVPQVTVSAGVSLQFRTDDLNKSIEELAGKYQHNPPDAKPWGSTYVYLRDPAGNQVIVFEGDV